VLLSGIGQSDVPGPTPSIGMGGVVNAANGAPTLVPGGLASVFGLNLAASTVLATTVPLPRSLGGVEVTVNGIPAPILFVSALQINFQVPFEISLDGPLSVAVVRGGVPSIVENAPVALYAPGFFINFATGEPYAQRFPDFTPISAANPAREGDVLIVYFNGVGGLTTEPETGDAAVVDPLSQALVFPTVTLGGVAQTVTFTGLAPGFVGLGQANIVLSNFPAALEAAKGGGNTLPLVMDFGGLPSIAVDLPVE